jgi:hypothetical protein
MHILHGDEAEAIVEEAFGLVSCRKCRGGREKWRI